MNAPDSQPDMLDHDSAGVSKPVEAPRLVVRINSVAMKMVFPFIAVDDVRYYLCGANIRPLDDGGAMICATDGHRFIVVRDPNGFIEEEVIVAVSKDAIKHADTEVTFDLMSNGTGLWNDKVTNPLFIQPGKSLIEGQFPRIEAVVDMIGYQEGISGAVQTAFLADALKIKTWTKAASIRFFTRDEDAPLLFVFDGIGGIECFGGIMKIRDTVQCLPKWLPPRGEFQLQRESQQ